MNSPFQQQTPTDGDDSLENDEPEPIYITMDPQEYIPPPDNYKPKTAKQNSNN